jgi:segregation and condensation protein B
LVAGTESLNQDRAFRGQLALQACSALAMIRGPSDRLTGARVADCVEAQVAARVGVRYGKGRRTMNSPADSSLDSSSRHASPSSADESWSVEEIERLYQKALDAVDAVANDLNAATDALTSETDSDRPEPTAAAGAQTTVGVLENPAESKAKTDAGGNDLPVGPEQVLEALLFVGGKPLTIKAIGTVLRGEFDAVFIEAAVEQLRERYASQNRPYEIHLTDGGYCIRLRSDFEPERNRLYGFGPRQVRLSQDTLEVLLLVAYRQPISRRSIEEIGKRGAGSHLRQLLQRELVVLERGDGGAGAGAEKDVTYRTSPRFLQLFGLRRLEELPQIEDLDFK